MQDVSTIPSTVQARDLHPGDVVRQYDWPLHVREVTLSQAAVTIAVVEFDAFDVTDKLPVSGTADGGVNVTVNVTL